MNQVFKVAIFLMMMGIAVPEGRLCAQEVNRKEMPENVKKSDAMVAQPILAAKNQWHQNIGYNGIIVESPNHLFDAFDSKWRLSSKMMNIAETRIEGGENEIFAFQWPALEEESEMEIIGSGYVIGLKFSYKEFHLKELYRSVVSLLQSKASSSEDEPTVSFYFDLP